MSLLAEGEANNVEEPPPVEDSHAVKSTADTTPPWIKELIQRRKAKSATGSTKEVTNVGQQWTAGQPSGNIAGNIATSSSTSTIGTSGGGGGVVGKKSTNLTGISSHLNANNSINKMPVVGLHGASSTAAINSDAAGVGVSVGGHYTTALKPQKQNEPQIYSELKGSLARIVRNNTTNNNNPPIACDSNDVATLFIQQKQVDEGIETVQPTRQHNQTSNLHMAAVADDHVVVGGGGGKTMATTTSYSNPINCLSGCSSQLTSICASSRTCFKPIGTVPPLQQHRVVQQKLNADEGNCESVGNSQRFITASHSSSCDDDSLVVVDGQPQAQAEALSKASFGFVCQLHLRVSCECDNERRVEVSNIQQQSCHGVASSVSNCQIEIELKKKSISCDSIVNSRNFNFISNKNNTKCVSYNSSSCSNNNNDITTTTTQTKCSSSSGDNVNDRNDDDDNCCGITGNSELNINSFVNNRVNNINNKTAAILPTSASFDSSVIFSKDTNTNSARKMVAAQELTDTFDLDTSEELQYGPGIVSKLRCRYLSLALRQSAAKQRPSLDILRRATSLNNLLDDDDDTTTAHHHHHHHHHHYHHEHQHQYQHQNHKTNGITGYNNQKNSTKLIENNSQQQNNVNPNYKIRTPDEFVATFKKNLKISEKDKQRSRNMQRGNDSLKRARSVEALIGCDNKSSWDELDTIPQPQLQQLQQQQQTSNNNTNNQNNNINNNSNNSNSSSKMLYQMQKSQKSSSVDEPISAISAISNDMVSISSAAEVTVEDKISNARERAANSSCDKVPKRRPPIMDDTERPPPDVVKQTLKIFEAGANRRGRGIQRNSMSGEVAAKVANYKSIIGQDRPPILFPKPPLSPKKAQNIRKNSNSISTTGSSCNNSNSVPAPSSGGAITNLDLVKKTTLNNNNNNNNNTTTATATTTINGNSTNSDANKNQNQNLKKFPISNYPITPAVHTAGKSVQEEDIPQPLKRTIQPKPSPKPEQQQQQSEEVKKLTDIPISKIDSNNFNDIVITTEGNDNFDSSRSAQVNVDTSFIMTEPERIIPFGTSTPIAKSQNHKQSITSEDIVDDNTVAILESPSSKTAGSHPVHYIIHTKPTTLTPREIEKNLINEKKNEESAEFQQISGVMADNGAIPPAPSTCDTSQPPQIQTQTQMQMQMPMQMPVQIQANPTVDTQPKWQVSKKKSRPTSQAPPNQGNSMVFNFKDRKDIPDYIENDGLLFKRRRELPRPNESGFVLLGDVSLETSTDPDDIWPMGPASPCNIEFENAYVLIDGKSSFRDQSKNATSFKVKFDDPLTTTFEYPSENCITDATTSTDSSTTPNRIDDSNINFNLNINEASNAPDVVIVHGLPQHYGTIPATNATSNNFQNVNTSNQSHIDGVVKSPGQKLLGSVSLGSSAPLGSYTPIKAQINTNFELGVTRTQPLSTTISSSTSTSTSSSGCNNDVTNNLQMNGNQNDPQNLIMANNRTGLTDNIYNNSIINESDVILNTDNIRNGTTTLMVDNNDDPQEDNLQYLKPATDDLTIVYSQGTKKTDLLY